MVSGVTMAPLDVAHLAYDCLYVVGQLYHMLDRWILLGEPGTRRLNWKELSAGHGFDCWFLDRVVTGRVDVWSGRCVGELVQVQWCPQVAQEGGYDLAQRICSASCRKVEGGLPHGRASRKYTARTLLESLLLSKCRQHSTGAPAVLHFTTSHPAVPSRPLSTVKYRRKFI